MVLLANETEIHSIARRILMIYKSSESLSYSLRAKGKVFRAIQVKALLEGPNLPADEDLTRELQIRSKDEIPEAADHFPLPQSQC